MSDVSWSGTFTLVMLWAIGPLIYLGIYIVGLMKNKKNNVSASEEKPSAAIEEDAAGADGDADGDGDGDDDLDKKEVDEKEKEEEDEPAAEAEDNWTSTQYLFSLVGYAIGIGNVWRFCYIIAKDGGSASLFAYVVCTIFVATPLFMYEMILGQYLRHHAASAWTYIKPRWEGLAITQFVMLLIAQSYFVMIIGYTVPYMIGSCSDPLPWTVHSGGSEGYWFEHVLGLKEYPTTGETDDAELVEVDGLEMQWSLVGSLFFVWVVVFLSVSFGKNILADITYVTVLAPVALMVILIIRTALLPGAIDGINYYIGKFDVAKLGEFGVWANALSQCLFSLSPGFGTAITMSSMTDKHEDVYKAAVITSVANTVFAVASGFAIFAMIGNIAFETGREVEDVASKGGQGLAFIVIASAMPTFGDAANALSAMFFFMLFTLGLDSSFCWAETLTATVEDFMEKYGGLTKDKRPATWITSLITCSFCFLIGLPYATSKGNIILDGVDYFVGINFLLFVCFVESLVLNFDFGWKRLEYALQKATFGKRTLLPHYTCCRFDFHIAIPFATFGLFMFQMVSVIQAPYLPDNPKIEALSWALFAICFALTFVGIWKRGDGQLAELPVPMDEHPWGVEYWAKQVGGAGAGATANEKTKTIDDEKMIGTTGDGDDDPSSNDLEGDEEKPKELTAAAAAVAAPANDEDAVSVEADC